MNIFNALNFWNFSKNDEIIELAPMIPPMNRTKRWIEENHKDLRTVSTKFHDTVVKI